VADAVVAEFQVLRQPLPLLNCDAI
jgi:hypothetical protein